MKVKKIGLALGSGGSRGVAHIGIIKALEEIGRERNIDVLCTTHNPYLIDSLGTDMIPCITYVKRNEHTGSSELNTLDENENLVNMMASGSIGLSMVKGRI